MADDNFGQWSTLSFGVPDFLASIRDTVNNFAELLTAFLEVAAQALEFSKSFAKGYLDPLVSLIEAIAQEVSALLQSLRSIGMYLTGDWALLGWPPEDLRGGYSGYEQRMIARMTDRTDPTRPDVASTTKVLGMFAYLSVDPSDYERLVNFLITLMQLFGLSFFPDSSRLPVPTIQDIQYGTATAVASTAFQFKPLGSALTTWSGDTPQKCRVSWVTRPASQKYPLNPFPQLGPSGYLVTVSTIPEGIPIKFARPRANTDKKPANGNKAVQVQPREYGDVLDMNGQPLVLHGGAEMLDFLGGPFEFNKGFQGGKSPRLKDGYCQVYGMVGSGVIPLEDLGPATPGLGSPGDGKGADFLLQRVFLITSGVTLAQWFSGEYGAIFNIEDMPLKAQWAAAPDGTISVVPGSKTKASTFYIRVWSVGKQVAESKAVPKWGFQKDIGYNANTAGQPFVVAYRSGPASVGNPSPSKRATFVGSNTSEYFKAIQSALLVLVLSRADLPYLDEIAAVKGSDTTKKFADGTWSAQGFAKTATGLEGARGLLSRLYSDANMLEMGQPGQDPKAWRANLLKVTERLTYEIYTRTGMNSRVEAAVVALSPELRNTTVGTYLKSLDKRLAATWEAALKTAKVEDVTLLDSLDPESPVAQLAEYGLAPNIYSTGLATPLADSLFFLGEKALIGRSTPFVMYQGGQTNLVFQESDPVKVLTLLMGLPDDQKKVYSKFIQADGSLNVPTEYRNYLTARNQRKRLTSSGDTTPVFMVARDQFLPLTTWAKGVVLYDHLIPKNPSKPYPAMVYTRGMIQGQTANGKSIYNQAAQVLRLACPERAPGDGEWVAFRLMDTWPRLIDFAWALENWASSLTTATESLADAIIKYIEFIQAQIVELQQIILRVNSLINSFLGFSFALPKFSGLLLLSDGTDGLLADFVAATNKPSDSPLSYGAGLALVAPYAPGFLLDIINVATAEEPGQPTQDLDGTTTTTRPPDAIGTEGVTPQPGPAPSSEPDVL